MANKEQTMIGTLTDISEKEKVVVLTMLVQGKEMTVSAFKNVTLPELKQGEDYEFTWHEFNGYANLSCIWNGQIRTGYKIKLAGQSRSPPASAAGSAKSAPPPTPGEKDARITRLSCVSSAVHLVGELVVTKKIKKASDALDAVLMFAERFEAFANGKKLGGDDIAAAV